MSIEVKDNSINTNNNQEKTTEIINLSFLESNSNIQNSEYILVIIEICINSSKYNLPQANSTRAFWDEVMNNETLFNILKVFKAETLRKYWRIMRDTNQCDKIVAIVKENSKQIDNPCYKLLPIINSICDFIKSNEDKDFNQYLMGINKTKQKKPNEKEKGIGKDKGKDKAYEEDEIGNENVYTFIKKKRNADNPIDKLNDKETIVLLPTSNINDNKPVVNPLNGTEDTSLDGLITALGTQFPNKKRDEIYKALYKTSGNIKDAYLYLTNPYKYKALAFLETDDYIIQNLRNKPYYEQMVAAKGNEKVKERELFLKVNTDK